MKKLLVEELESRDLLNASGLFQPPMPAARSNTPPSPPAAHFDRAAAPIDRPGQFPQGSAGRGSLATNHAPAPDPSSPTARNSMRSDLNSSSTANPALGSTEVTAQSSIATAVSIPLAGAGAALIPQATSSLQSVTRPGNNFSLLLSSTVNASVSAPPAGLTMSPNGSTDLEMMSEAAQAATSSAAAVEALAAALSVRPDPLVSSRENAITFLNNSASLRSSRSVELVALRGGREADGPSEPLPVRPGQPQQEPEPGQQPPRQPPASKAARAAAVLLPQLADLLNEVSLPNLAHIDQCVSAFLSKLEGSPSQPNRDGAQNLYPWVLTGVVTAAACAMALRHLRKTPALQSFDWLSISANPWSFPHEHDHGRAAR